MTSYHCVVDFNESDLYVLNEILEHTIKQCEADLAVDPKPHSQRWLDRATAIKNLLRSNLALASSSTFADRPAYVEPLPSSALLKALEDIVLKPDSELSWAEQMDPIATQDDLIYLLGEMAKELGSRQAAWTVLLRWLAQQLNGTFTLSSQAERLIADGLKTIAAEESKLWIKILDDAVNPNLAHIWGR